MARELEPVNITDYKNLWHKVVEKVNLDLDAVLPVQMMDPDSNLCLGSFHASFVKEQNQLFIMQVENFDTPEWAETFLTMYESDWEIYPGGIYRMRLGK